MTLSTINSIEIPNENLLQNARSNSAPGSREVSLGEIKHNVFIYQLLNKWKLIYKAFCSGSIISENRVITSTHCFLTNRKRKKHNFNNLRIVAGILHTIASQPISDDIQQWRSIGHLYSQRYYRFPAYNLAIVEVDTPWVFNNYVNKIPYTKWNQNFDGLCRGIGLKSKTSWSEDKKLHKVYLTVIERRSCEHRLLRSCEMYYCTKYDTMKLTSTAAEGGGLVCHGTGDPFEDENLGVLVGVTSLINIGLPSLHNRIGLYYKWVTDNQTQAKLSFYIVLACILINLNN